MAYTKSCVAHLISLFGEVLELKLEFLKAVIQPLDFFLHLSLLLLSIGYLQQRLHLGEQTPPLPVAQLQVALHVALDDADCTELLHTLLVGPEGREGGAEGGRCGEWEVRREGGAEGVRCGGREVRRESVHLLYQQVA